jgi:hypothetical protein
VAPVKAPFSWPNNAEECFPCHGLRRGSDCRRRWRCLIAARKLPCSLAGARPPSFPTLHVANHPSILGGHEGDRITLILHELGSRQVPGPAEFLGMDLPGASALDRFRYADEVSNPSPVKYALLPFSDCMRESL